MPDEIIPTPLAGDALELAKLRAGLSAGLTVEQSARLSGTDEATLTADAAAYSAEMSAANPVPQAPRVGGPRGTDVTGGAGTVAAGVAAYRQRAGLDENGQKPPVAPRTGDGRNPFRETTYRLENR
ncbi:hypothetical protein [Streptomyces sp. NPDC048411]|uniref:hypothetical protein n=1 Tax=Streptomyces sp. NPDC048411 TaxID=3157206 RepID=UPI0034538F11